MSCKVSTATLGYRKVVKAQQLITAHLPDIQLKSAPQLSSCFDSYRTIRLFKLMGELHELTRGAFGFIIVLCVAK